MTDRLMYRLPGACLALLLAGGGGFQPASAQAPSSAVELAPVTVTGAAEPTLTQPGAAAAREAIERTPGAVEVVDDTAWKDKAAATLKDVFDYTPGVFAQPKWGEDTRFSIRGSGLSRNFHLRGVQLYQDGIPFNNADGGGDFQEIDPTAYRYVELYKGANGLRYGANALGGAVNFVTPSGYDARSAEGRVDAGSFGFRRLQASAGGHDAGLDGFLTGSFLSQDGFREHSAGESKRAAGNLGWRISDALDTRFYVGAADIWQQIPGSVTKDQALDDPRAAAAGNLAQDYQRNVESWRVASKTSLRLGEGTAAEVGGYYVDRHLIHPIFQVLDYRYHDWGGFGRLEDEREVFGRDNRLTLGLTVAGGWVDNEMFVNVAGQKGARTSASTDRSTTTTFYGENALELAPELVPGLSLVTGLQVVHATREREDEFADAVDTSGKATYDFVNPKVGLLWQVDPGWQLFGNVSRSGEAPTFSELNFTNAALSDLEAQRATTFEVGTRGERDDLTWDLAFYRAQLDNEFQFFDLGGGNYSVANADRTIHQGVEAGLGWSPIEGLFEGGAAPDRLWLNAAYTFSDFRFDDDPAWGDNELPGAPRHFLRAELLYRHPSGFFAGPNLEWVPQAYYVDNANSQETEPYALLGFRAGYELSDRVSLFLEGRNLTDEAYIASTSVAAVATSASALYEPGTGRAVFAGLTLRW